MIVQKRRKKTKEAKIVYIKEFPYKVSSPTPHTLYWKEAENKLWGEKLINTEQIKEPGDKTGVY